LSLFTIFDSFDVVFIISETDETKIDDGFAKYPKLVLIS